MIILKLGGSLIQRAKRIVKDIIEYTNSTGETTDSSGGFNICRHCAKGESSEEAAHWMAMLAMEQYGYYLADGTDAKLIDNLEIPEKVHTFFFRTTSLKRKMNCPIHGM